MKKTMLLVLIIVMMSGGIFAQVRIGIIGGINISSTKQKNFVSPDFHSKTKYAIGGLIEYAPWKNLSFVIEPMYVEKANETEIGIDLKHVGMDMNLSYMEIPFLLKYSVGEKIRPYFLAGATIGFNINSTANLDFGPLMFGIGMENFMSTTEFSFTFGGGVSFLVDDYLMLMFEAKYNFGMSNIIKSGRTRIGFLDFTEVFEIPSEVNYSTRGLQLMVGISLPIILQ